MNRNRQSDRDSSVHADVETLFSKHGQTVAALARSILERIPGDRITRVHEYAARLDASAGTVQAALNYLTSVGAVRLEARGRLGTYVHCYRVPVTLVTGNASSAGGCAAADLLAPPGRAGNWPAHSV